MVGIPPREVGELTRLSLVLDSLAWSSIAIGAYLLLRRRLFGLLLVFVLVAKALSADAPTAALAIAAVLLLVFLLPYALVAWQLRGARVRDR